MKQTNIIFAGATAIFIGLSMIRSDTDTKTFYFKEGDNPKFLEKSIRGRINHNAGLLFSFNNVIHTGLFFHRYTFNQNNNRIVVEYNRSFWSGFFGKSRFDIFKNLENDIEYNRLREELDVKFPDVKK